MEPLLILNVILGFVIFEFALGKVLTWLNIRNMSPELPEIVKGSYDSEKYSKSQTYIREKTSFGLIGSIISFVLMVSVLVFGWLGWWNDLAAEWTTNTYLHAVIFFGIIFILNDILSIPFSLYDTFVIEEKYGFNRTSIGTFILDRLKGYLMTGILGGGIMVLLFYLIDVLGENFWLIFWVIISVVMLILQFFMTTLILPLFNKLSPLENDSLQEKIESYSKEVDFPMQKVLVMDGSKRSSKGNAFFAGFGKNKRIVLYDTLIEQLNDSELIAVLAHEVGHYKKKHVILRTILGVLTSGLMLFIMSRVLFSPEISQALGGNSHSLPLNLVGFGMLYAPISMITGMVMNLISRKNEYEADQFAAETSSGKDLSMALLKMHEENLSNLTPHPASVFMSHSHPTLVQRITHLKTFNT